MVRRVLGVLFVLIGGTSIWLGVQSATEWKTAETVTATSPTVDVPVVVIEPGVAGIAAPVVDITITAAAPDQTITLITSRDVDINGWIGDAAVQRITDLADWEELVTQTVEGAAEVPDPTVSDMWWKVEQFEGSVTLEDFPATTDRTAMMIVRDGATGPAPTVAFTWDREVLTPYLIPLVAAGVAAIVIGLGLVVSSFVSRSRKRGAAAAAETAGTTAQGASGEALAVGESVDLDGATPVARGAVSDPGPGTAETMILTRRQLRAQRSEADEPDVTKIAAGITAASDEAAAPDAPDSYPDWLRADASADVSADGDGVSGVGVSGEELPTAERTGGDAWRRRWGVTAVRAEAAAAAAGAAAVVSEGEKADGGEVEKGDAVGTDEADAVGTDEADVTAADEGPEQLEPDSGSEADAVVDPAPDPDPDPDADPEPAPDPDFDAQADLESQPEEER